MSPGRLLFTAGYLLVWPALVLLLAGDWTWPEGWIFGGWFVATRYFGEPAVNPNGETATIAAPAPRRRKRA